MSATVTDYSSYNPPAVQEALIETITSDSVLLQAMPWDTTAGSKYEWWREKGEDKSISYRSVNGDFQDGSPDVEEEHVSLRILGGSMTIDKFLVDTDVKGLTPKKVDMKIKSVGLKIMRDLIKSRSSIDPAAFDGLYALLSLNNDFYIGKGVTELVGFTGFTPAERNRSVARGIDMHTAVSGDQGLQINTDANLFKLLQGLNQAIARMPVKPDIALMGAGVWALLQDALNKSGIVRVSLNEFGMMSEMYNGIKLVQMPKNSDDTEIMDFDELSPDGVTNADCGSILLIKFGIQQFYWGIRNQNAISISEPRLLPKGTKYEWVVDYPANHIIGRKNSVVRIGGIRQ